MGLATGGRECVALDRETVVSKVVIEGGKAVGVKFWEEAEKWRRGEGQRVSVGKEALVYAKAEAAPKILILKYIVFFPCPFLQCFCCSEVWDLPVKRWEWMIIRQSCISHPVS